MSSLVFFYVMPHLSMCYTSKIVKQVAGVLSFLTPNDFELALCGGYVCCFFLYSKAQRAHDRFCSVFFSTDQPSFSYILPAGLSLSYMMCRTRELSISHCYRREEEICYINTAMFFLYTVQKEKVIKRTKAREWVSIKPIKTSSRRRLGSNAT